MVVGKDDALAYALSALHLQTVLHQVLQHAVDSVDVEDIVENLLALNVPVLGVSFNSPYRLLILPHLLELFFLLCTQVVILDTLFQDEWTTLETLVVDKVTLGNGILQFVGIVGHTLFHLEGLVGALVHLVSWCRCQAHEQSVKVVEDGWILAEDAAVRLVDDNQVKPPHAEGFLVGVDVVNHRLIGRESDAGIGVGVFILAQDGGGHVGQQFHEVLVRLADQRNPVGKEQDVLHPSVTGQHVN